ncbi:MAG: threonylcarbamoyl-AMP synthase [Ignavibacteria bacterium RBG_16_34_14]|nr:MAG: threonylcarbamoyl-AMP synthase [Ignavibacteria bacterium RBG_16_34_14]
MIKSKLAELFDIDNNIEEAVQIAKKLYLEGTIFIHPTDTIYGFAANPFNEEAVNKIDKIKQRPSSKKYILLINNIDNLLTYADIHSEKHLDFLLSIWPNPVSVVLKLNKKTSKILDIETAAFRIPNNRFCLKLLDTIKMPVISTSVNRSNEKPLFDPIMIRDEFGSDVDTIFYTNKKLMHEYSTLIDLTNNKMNLIREGKIKFDDLLKKLN